MKRNVGDRHSAAGGGPRLRWALGVLLLGLQAQACTERKRPGRLSDVSAEDSRQVLTGSFRAPTGDAAAGDGPAGGGGASGCDDASSPCGGELDAGATAASSTGAGSTGAGSTGAGSAGAAGAASGSAPAETSDHPITARETYAAVCEDSTVQWGFFIYRATTPGDSSIRMRVRTAPTEDQLQSATFLELANASTVLGTALCSFTGPAPCPIDLFDRLGGAPLAHHPLSELEIVLTPSSTDQRLPTVEEWQLDYSCTFNQ